MPARVIGKIGVKSSSVAFSILQILAHRVNDGPSDRSGTLAHYLRVRGKGIYGRAAGNSQRGRA